MELKVVLVDDDPIVLFLHKMIVKRSTLPPVSESFRNGREALQAISGDGVSEKPYLILLDINMPVMNGWEFLDAVQKQDFRKNIYVAVVSTSINSYDLAAAKNYPQVVEYLEKPLNTEDLQKLHSRMEFILVKDK